MTQVYQFPKKKTRAVKVSAFTKARLTAQVEEPIGLVQGIIPDSRQEWYVARALWILKIGFYYQYPIAGGKTVRGGQVIDFYVNTVPLPTPVLVQGTYWHRPAKRVEDLYKIEKIKQILSGKANDPVELPETELQSVDDAIKSIRRRVL
jgi:hypothetical protein